MSILCGENAKKGLIIVLSGPSGVGKGTVLKCFANERSDFTESVSITTRKAREGEKEGVDYYFRSEEDFKALLKKGEILEYDEFDGAFYGTPAETIRNAQAEGQNIILEITVTGAKAIKSMFPQAALIFLLPPDEETLAERLRKRGTQSETSLITRLNKAKEEISELSGFDYALVNDELETAVEDLRSVIRAEELKCRKGDSFRNYLGENCKK